MSPASGMDRVIALSKTLRRLQSLGWLPSLSFALRRRQCEEQVPRLRTKIQGLRVHDISETLGGCQFMYMIWYMMMNLKSTETFTWYISICLLFGYFFMERCLFFLPKKCHRFRRMFMNTALICLPWGQSGLHDDMPWWPWWSSIWSDSTLSKTTSVAQTLGFISWTKADPVCPMVMQEWWRNDPSLWGLGGMVLWWNGEMLYRWDDFALTSVSSFKFPDVLLQVFCHWQALGR